MAIHTETYNYNYNGEKDTEIQANLSAFTVKLDNDFFPVIVMVIGLSVNGP